MIYAHIPLVFLFFPFFFTQARALLQTASSLAPHMYEPHFNFATISDKVFSFFINVSSHLFLFLSWFKKSADNQGNSAFLKNVIFLNNFCIHVFPSRDCLINCKGICHLILTKLNTIIDFRRIILCFKI